jgi:hypothetical protein
MSRAFAVGIVSQPAKRVAPSDTPLGELVSSEFASPYVPLVLHEGQDHAFVGAGYASAAQGRTSLTVSVSRTHRVGQCVRPIPQVARPSPMLTDEQWHIFTVNRQKALLKKRERQLGRCSLSCANQPRLTGAQAEFESRFVPQCRSSCQTSAHRQRFAYGRITPDAAHNAVQQPVGRSLPSAQPSCAPPPCLGHGGGTDGTGTVAGSLTSDLPQLEPCLEPRVEPPDLTPRGTPSGPVPVTVLTLG